MASASLIAQESVRGVKLVPRKAQPRPGHGLVDERTAFLGHMRVLPAQTMSCLPYGVNARGPLGTYNFTGDLGKAAIPALASLLLTFMPWRKLLWCIALLDLATGGVVATLLPATGQGEASEATASHSAGKPARGAAAGRRGRAGSARL